MARTPTELRFLSNPVEPFVPQKDPEDWGEADLQPEDILMQFDEYINEEVGL